MAIDLFSINIGTKYSYLAALDKGTITPKLIKKFPSEIIVTNQVDRNDISPSDFFSGYIRLIGRNYNEPIVQKEKEKAPFKIIKGPDGNAWVETSYGRQLPPSELLQMLLVRIKAAAEAYLGGKISVTNTYFVVTFPGRVLSSLCTETTNQAIRAGIPKAVVVHEFSAAAVAVAYQLHKRRGMFGVVCFGARTMEVTFWISPLNAANGYHSIKGLPLMDLYLGGDDFDSVIVKHLESEFKKMEGIDLVEDKRLRKAAEEAKIALSSSNETCVDLPNIITDLSQGSRDLKITLTREMFESLAGVLSERIKELCVKSLHEAGIHAKKLKDVILVGGMANVPIVRKVVKEVFGKDPKRGVDNETAVALGAVMAVGADGTVGVNELCIDS